MADTYEPLELSFPSPLESIDLEHEFPIVLPPPPPAFSVSPQLDLLQAARSVAIPVPITNSDKIQSKIPILSQSPSPHKEGETMFTEKEEVYRPKVPERFPPPIRLMKSIPQSNRNRTNATEARNTPPTKIAMALDPTPLSQRVDRKSIPISSNFAVKKLSDVSPSIQRSAVNISAPVMQDPLKMYDNEKSTSFSDSISYTTDEVESNRKNKPSLNHTLSSPSLSGAISPKQLKSGPPVPPRPNRLLAMSGSGVEGILPTMGMTRSETFSDVNINWEFFETQILDAKPEEAAQVRDRGDRKSRWNAYTEKVQESVESQRMRQFVDVEETKDYGDLFQQLVKEHKDHGDDTSPTNNESSTVRRKRSLSSVNLNRRIEKPSGDYITVDKSQEKDKKKRKAKKNSKKYNLEDNPPPIIAVDAYLEFGESALHAVRETNPMSLPAFLSYVKETSTLPTALKQPINALYFDEFEADDECTIELKTDSADPESNIIYATIFKLIQRLSHHAISSNAKLLTIFLLTYRSLITPQELLELLVCRSFTEPSSEHSRSNWKAEQTVIRNRLLVIACQWVEKYYICDFSKNDKTLFLLAHFIGFIDPGPHSKPFLDIIHSGIGRNIVREQTLAEDAWASQSLKKKGVPKPHLPKAGLLTLMDIHPIEIARQFALMDKAFFEKINPGEYANQGWCRTDKELRSPNIVKMITQFNHICNWTASVLLQENLKEKHRAIILCRLIVIAEESRALHNYNAVMAILSGLQSAPIYRLKNTWELLPTKTWDIWDQLNVTMSNKQNFTTYRKILEVAPSPCVPYIGIFLTDLVFIEDGNVDYKPDTRLINVKKLHFTAGILHNLEKCKGGSYPLIPVPSIQAYLIAFTTLSQEQQKQKSLEIQPLGT